MLAIKGHYKNGRIDFIEPVPGDIREANVIVIIPDYETDEPAQGYFEIIDANGVLHKMPNWTDEEWKEIGLRSFFETAGEDDEGVEIVVNEK